MKTRRPNKRISPGLNGGAFLDAPPLRAGAEAVALAVVLCLAVVLSPYQGLGADPLPQVLVVGPLSAMLAAARTRLGGGGWRANLPREGTWGLALTAVVTTVGLVAMVAVLGGPASTSCATASCLCFRSSFGTSGRSCPSACWRTCGRGGPGSGGAGLGGR